MTIKTNVSDEQSLESCPLRGRTVLRADLSVVAVSVSSFARSWTRHRLVPLSIAGVAMAILLAAVFAAGWSPNDPPRPSPSDVAALHTGSGDREAQTRSSSLGLWTRQDAWPSSRRGHAMAYDAQSDRTILFGGLTAEGVMSNETWAYDLETNAWTEMNPFFTPSPRSGHAMAYDAGSDRVILFGGYTGTYSGETWAYDFETDAWTEMNPPSRPSRRTGPAMAYDAQSDRAILLGGFGVAWFSSETWAYDFGADNWTQMAPAFELAFAAMAYDAESDRSIVFGGSVFGPIPVDSTLAFDFESNTWTMTYPAYRPPGRSRHAMAYDSVSDRVILVGGDVGPGEPWVTTWAYDFNSDTWSRLTPWNPPAPRLGLAMAYDAQSQAIVLFGGWWDGTSFDDTWAYDGAAVEWTYRTPAPRFRRGHAMGYDAQSNRIILFGGEVKQARSQYDDETWTYDFESNLWTNMNPPAKPWPRVGHAMVYDAQSDRTILFGGYYPPALDDTWAYDYETNTWTVLSPPSRPSARYGHAMAYDAQSDRIILFGGSRYGPYNNETWAYDFESSTWTKMSPVTGPSARAGHAMVYDAQSDRIILFGGETAYETYSDGTWAYDFEADAWTDLRPGSSPPPRAYHGMVFDAQSRAAVLYGGWPSSGGTWAYAPGSNTWIQLRTPTEPTRRAEHAMAYDVQSDQIVLFGGWSGYVMGETWSIALDAYAAPHFDIPVPFFDVRPREIQVIGRDGDVQLEMAIAELRLPSFPSPWDGRPIWSDVGGLAQERMGIG